ncbi:serine/threonine protein kinase [Streptomyces sp. SID12501]|uniref:Serine/threonine protein kinase n=1 Tax=Streptomyces sp. SID12501 TaxID=2706042 RepID=A0A6B3BLK0_9ACTN|nr:serine/threonine protein kinase [Streptomyces sp. SID12501]
MVQLPDAVVRHSDAPPPEPRLLRLSPGQSAEFGRGEPGAPLPIPLRDPAVSRCAGQITAVEDYWRLCNYSGAATYVVENLEGAGEHIRVAPGRIGAPVPFELSRVILPAETPMEFKVFAPQHAYVEHGCDTPAGEPTTIPFSLNPSSKYFLVLLALCEPRLRSPSSAAVPGVGEILERLLPLPSCHGLTRSALNYHIDYLADTKLRLREGAGGSYSEAGGKRERLVSLALRFNLVREDHLVLLPPAARL